MRGHFRKAPRASEEVERGDLQPRHARSARRLGEALARGAGAKLFRRHVPHLAHGLETLLKGVGRLLTHHLEFLPRWREALSASWEAARTLMEHHVKVDWKFSEER